MGLSLRLLASTASIAWLAVNAPVHAQSPQAPTVAAGSIAVTRQGATTVVSQTTDRGIIDWRSFSIGAGEAVRFDQPGRSSVTLNRVTGSELSRIDGNLSANGQVWLANPNGVLIGNSGQANVGGLLATTGRIDAAEFLKSGRAAIDQIGKEAGIANFGTVNIAEGGYAALAAASIRNEGVVAARKGSVALGAGKAVTVDFTGDKLITFQVTKPLDQAVPGDSMISSGGVIAAEGGTVLMSARAAKGVMDNVINLKGHVVANSVNIDGGTVSFGDGGVVQVSGKIDASNPSGKGGEVAILGEKVGLMDGASVDASGSFGGGTVLVGGDWQGKGPAHNATIAYVAPTASINADATMAGDGGKVVVWADDSTRFNGSISARGGILAGNGGQVETSGKRALDVSPQARVTSKGRAAGAKAGGWLLDPTDITIVATGGAVALSGGSFTPVGASTTIDVGVINTALNNGDNVTLQTASAGSGAGDITFASGTITTSFSGSALTLKLLANRDILLNSGTKIDLSGAAHNIVLNSGAGATTPATVIGGILLDGATVKTSGGAISMVGGSGGSFAARFSAGYSFLTEMSNGVNLRTASLVDAGAGSVLIVGAARSGIGSSAGHGVYVSGGTVKGDSGVVIKGTGSADASVQSYGVYLDNGAKAQTNGGVLTIEGVTSGNAFTDFGVYFFEAGITSVSGSVSITGTGGPGLASAGVYAYSTSFDLGSGATNITGTAGAGTGTGIGFKNGGVVFTGDFLVPTKISGSGSLTIKGTGGGSGSTTTNSGVRIENTNGSLSGAGALTIVGIRGVGDVSSNVSISGLNALQTTSGSISIDGSSTAGGASSQSHGVVIGQFVGSSSGSITIMGAVAPAATSSIGVLLSTVGRVVTLGAGGMLIRGAGSASTAGVDIKAYGSASNAQTQSGDITIQTNRLDQSGSGVASLISSAAGTIRIQPLSPIASIGVGGALGDLAVSSALLNRIGGKIEIGGVDHSGAINVASGLTLPISTTFRSKDGAINLLGSVSGQSYLQSLSLLSATGPISIAGPLDLFSTLKVSGGSIAVGGSVTTGNAQTYVDPVTLTGDTYFKSKGTGLISFNGKISGAGKILSLSTENGAVSLSTLEAATLSVSTKGGSVSQIGKATVTTNALIDAGSGAVTLTNAGNSIAELALTAGDASVTVSGGMKLSNTTVSSLTLTATGTVTQIGPLSASSLSLKGAGGVYDLTNSGNTIVALTGDTSKIAVTNSDASSLQVDSAGVTVDSGLTLTQSGSGQTLTLNGPINLGSSTATLKSGGTIDGVIPINGSGATLNLDAGANGSSVITSGAVTANVLLSDVTVNGVLLSSGPTPPPVTPPVTPPVETPSVTVTVATVSSPPPVVLSSSPTVATSASVPTVDEKPAVRPVLETPAVGTPVVNAPVTTGAVTTEVSETPATSAGKNGAMFGAESALLADTSPVQTTIGAEPIAVVMERLMNTIATAPGASSPTAIPVMASEPESKSNRETKSEANSEANGEAKPATAEVARKASDAVPVGALMPSSLPIVPGTGAPLLMFPTIRVDAADAGVAGGQVVAFPSAGEGGGNSRSVIKGMLSEEMFSRNGLIRREPPLAEQASTMNEEQLLD